jgi:AraC-like DNA-binding protein
VVLDFFNQRRVHWIYECFLNPTTYAEKADGRRMIDQHTKRDAGALRVLLDLAAEAGIDAATILKESRLSADDVFTPEAEIEVWQELSAIKRIVRKKSWMENALNSGARLHITSHGTLGYAMLASRDLRDALRIASRFHSVSLWLCEVTTRRVDDTVQFAVLPHALPEECQDYCALRGVASLKVWMEDLLRRKIFPERVRLNLAKPDQAKMFEEFFDGPPEFGSNSYTISFKRELFREPLTFADPWMRQKSKGELQRLKQRRGASYASKVRELILDAPQKNGSEKTVSTELKISGSTLRRRLREEGTTFRDVRADTLHAMACLLLAGTSKNIDEIAYQLGYSEAASFVRSFRRQENISPGVWRREQRSANRVSTQKTDGPPKTRLSKG